MVESWNLMMSQNRKALESVANKSSLALYWFLKNQNQQIELERVSRVDVLMIKSGASIQNETFFRVIERCLQNQKPDGGWADVEDSIWALSLLKQFNSSYVFAYKQGMDWLIKQELDNGGWGKSRRDMPRIPITATLFYLLPEICNKNRCIWLENQWKKDFAINPKLTYKAGFYLMGLSNASPSNDCNIYNKTIEWLASQQNDDFGWGPWRDHPVGSSPFCTGVALIGLLQYPELVDRQVIVNGLEWIRQKQLPNGLWPDHYIEEGSAWCFYALTEGYRFLKSHP